MHARHVRYHITLALTLACGLTSSVFGQNALGDGRGLEARLQTQPQAAQLQNRTLSVVNPIRSFSSELAFRESILSGTAPDGLSFRGARLPSRFEFRGELGEDALFAFRRDSLYSGLAGRGIRGTDALQYQTALTIGGQVPRSLAGQISYARAGTSERGADPTQPLQRDLQGTGLRRVSPDEDLLVSAIEAGSPMIHPVRSVSSYAANQQLQPTLVGLLQNPTTQRTAGQTASPLLGVQEVPIEALRSPIGSRVPDLAVPPTMRTPGLDPTTGQNPAGQSPLNAGGLNQNVPSQNPGGQGLPSQSLPGQLTQPGQTGNQAGARSSQPAYQQMISRYRGLYEPAGLEAPDGEMPAWAKDLVSLQRTLRGIPDPVVRPRAVNDEEAAENPDQPTTDFTPQIEPFRPEVLRRVREAGGMTDSLIATDLARIDRYSAYMRTAEEMLAAERYFDAEEVFISALSARQADVNASVGRAHAQIGAGLFLSAGLNVRQLLVKHPEISGMKYGAGLLPGAERMRQVSATLRQSLDSATSGADSGLLLAYLGFQRGIETDIRDGLDALETHGDEADARLAEMLRGVWLDEMEAGAVESPSEDG